MSMSTKTAGAFRRRALVVGALVAAVSGGVTLVATQSSAAAQPAAQPAAGRHTHVTLAANRDFPDPGFMKYGNTYYLYATGPGFTVASSTNPNGRFTVRGASMPNTPSWVAKDPSGHRDLWAPQVFYAPDAADGNKFTMYFSGYSKTHKTICIGAAKATSPLGPFRSVGSTPFVCGPNSSYRTIDPTMMTAGGKRYLVYKLAHNSTSTFSIHALQVEKTTGRSRAPQGINRNLVTVSGSIMEAPSIVLQGNKIWLFVSRGSYKASCSSYTTQVWSASSFLGKYHVVRTMPMTSPSGSSFCSAGGAAVINDGGTYRIAFHAYSGHSTSGARRAWTGVVKWDSNGTPYLY